LESENQLLSSEAEQLRQVRCLALIDDLSLILIQEIRVLEENLDNSVKEDISALEKPPTPNTDNGDGRQIKSKERCTQLEVSERG
jgi:hypothetical protein